MTDNTEATIDTLLEDFDVWCRCESRECQRSVNYEQSKRAIRQYVSDQVAKAREEERNNVWKSFHKAYDNGDKAGDYIIKGVVKKAHANNRKFRVECYWCGGVMYRYSNKFKAKHIMCSCWHDEEKRADRIATINGANNKE